MLNNYESVVLNMLGLPLGIPPGADLLRTGVKTNRKFNPPPLELPGANLPRSVSYLADKHGCGWWRIMQAGILLELNQKMILNEFSIMVTDPQWYQNIKSVLVQRQASPHQVYFVRYLKELSKEMGFKIIYEIDDIIFKEDIPDYNRCKEGFDKDEIRNSILEMMQNVDEITVTCDFMRDYYKHKTQNHNITVIPNYPSRFWFDRFYNEDKLEKLYYKHKKRPRVGCFISSTHIDIMNKTGQKDDYTHVVDAIIKSRKDIDWVWSGAYPLPIKPFIDSGEMSTRDWAPLMYFPQSMAEADINLTFVALQDNIFNKSKSDIKLKESACIGYPAICQDMVTYKDAILKFKTGDELIDQIKASMKDVSTYMKLCRKHRAYMEPNWLDNEKNIGKHFEVRTTPYQSNERKFLLETNPTL